MKEDELINEISNAFISENYPGDLKIVYNNSGEHLECLEVRENFKGKSWQSLSNTFLFEQRYSLSFFSNEAFKYYFPAFMIYSINNFYDADDLPDNIILKLTLPTEIDVVIVANAIKKYKIDEQMTSIDFNELLQNQLQYKNQDVHNFIARFSQFTTDQGKAIKHYLDFIQQEYKDEYPHNGPDVAIERYWFQFEL